MNKKLLLLPLIACATNSKPFNISEIVHSFDEQMQSVDEYFEKVRQEMGTMRQRMMFAWDAATKEPSAQPQFSINIDDSITDIVNITISGLPYSEQEKSEIKAHVEFDEKDNPTGLIITTDSTIIRLDYTKEYHFLSVGIQHEVKKMKKDEDEKEKTTHSVMIGTTRHGKTLSSTIQLDQPIIDYNQDDSTLTIKIPKVMPEKKGKAIPVTIK